MVNLMEVILEEGYVSQRICCAGVCCVIQRAGTTEGAEAAVD